MEDFNSLAQRLQALLRRGAPGLLGLGLALNAQAQQPAPNFFSDDAAARKRRTFRP